MIDKPLIVMRTLAFFTGLLLLPVMAAHGQSVGVDSLPHKRSVWRLGGGTGLLVPLSFPRSIYWQAGINIQLGATHEYYWRRRVSLLTGAEFRLQNLVADASFLPTTQANYTGKRIIAQPAPDSVKYASLQYQMLSIPVMIRYYFARNATRRVFLDTGVSFNFPLSVGYRHRTNGLTRRDKVTPFVHQPIVLIELAAGANGQVFSGRLTKANNLLGALLFGGFLGIDSSIRTPQNKTVVTAGLLTKFVF
jgi:hypothetical protein